MQTGSENRPNSARRRSAAIVAIGTALALAACGSSGSSTPPGPKPVTIPFPTATVPTVQAESSVASFLPAAVRSRGTLRIAVVVNRTPDAFVRSGQLVGLDIDLARAIAAVLGMKVRFSQVTVAAAVDDLKHGTEDLAFGVPNSELGSSVLGVPYVRSGIQVVGVPKVGTVYSSSTPVCNVSVAEVRGADANAGLVAQNAACAAAHEKDPTVHTASDLEHAVGLIAAHQASVAWLDSTAANYVVAELGGEYTMVSPLISPVNRSVAVANPDSGASGVQLGNAVGSALNSLIASGTYVTILQKWGLQGGALTSRDIAVVH